MLLLRISQQKHAELLKRSAIVSAHNHMLLMGPQPHQKHGTIVCEVIPGATATQIVAVFRVLTARPRRSVVVAPKFSRTLLVYARLLRLVWLCR